MTRAQLGYSLLLLLALFATLWFLLSPSVPQPGQYHVFADTRIWLNIPNTFNVLSNLPFVFVGLLGLKLFFSPVARRHEIISRNLIAYRVLWLGVLLVGFGSSYYHWAPGNTSLMWDRLPIAMSLMAICAILVGEHLSNLWGRVLLFPLVFLGLFSVFDWWLSEQAGMGDLKLYLLVQFLPMLAIPVILLCFAAQIKSTRHYWRLLLLYGLAKLAEQFDQMILDVTSVLSGHTLKHLLAALGLYLLLTGYRKQFTYAFKKETNTALNDN